MEGRIIARDDSTADQILSNHMQKIFDHPLEHFEIININEYIDVKKK
jgi:hypothetical protein